MEQFPPKSAFQILKSFIIHPSIHSIMIGSKMSRPPMIWLYFDLALFCTHTLLIDWPIIIYEAPDLGLVTCNLHICLSKGNWLKFMEQEKVTKEYVS